MSRKLKLGKEWSLGDRIGSGGFGQVFHAFSPGEPTSVAKLVRKEPGAQRELLFVDLAGVRNVVPVIDSGETGDCWVLVMPLAEMSLRDHIQRVGAALNVSDSLNIMSQVCAALVDLCAKGIVHRDLKPENILLLNGTWCLADFGISRYAEATTAPDTRKFSLSPFYAAPERWRVQRATSATDIYSMGVIGYELLSGAAPFRGAKHEDLREHHLHSNPAPIRNVVPAADGLIAECLLKSPEARPTPANVLARLDQIRQKAYGTGLARLRDAHRSEIDRRSEKGRIESARQSEAERRSDLAADARHGLDHISLSLLEAITLAAPSVLLNASSAGYPLRLNQSSLQFSGIELVGENPWGQPSLGSTKFSVIACAQIAIKFPLDRLSYEGRSHSLWYCDAWEAGQYRWFETAFMISPLISRRTTQNPFALDPCEEAAGALALGMAQFQVAWPFTPIFLGQTDEFIERWGTWFADAAEGKLTNPSRMPERNSEGTWRRW